MSKRVPAKTAKVDDETVYSGIRTHIVTLLEEARRAAARR